MKKRVDIITIIIVLVTLAGWFFDYISIMYLIPLVITYLIINIIGSSNIQLNYFLNSYCNGNTKKKEIALTFDDGPHPENTPKLLDVLQKNNVRASFFCTGEAVLKHHHIVKQIFNEGHIVGNHTYYHSRYFDLFSTSRMVHEIIYTTNIIYKTIGRTPLLFRPPYGVTNPMLMKALKRTKMFSIGWSLRSFDTVKNTDVVLKKLKSKTQSGDIVLFHDTIPETISIVSDYLDWLKLNNYEVVSLTSLLNIPAYEV